MGLLICSRTRNARILTAIIHQRGLQYGYQEEQERPWRYQDPERGGLRAALVLQPGHGAVDAVRHATLILIDSATAFAVVAIKRPSRASVITGVSSGVFLAVNVAGFVAWYLYFPPATYDAVCSVVYIAMLAALINEGSNGRRRLALHGMGVSSAGAPVSEGVGLHHKDADKI